jgi:hypothetical protein
MLKKLYKSDVAHIAHDVYNGVIVVAAFIFVAFVYAIDELYSRLERALRHRKDGGSSDQLPHW